MKTRDLYLYMITSGLIFLVLYFNYLFDFLAPKWENYFFQFEYLLFLTFFVNVIRGHLRKKK